MKNLILPPKSVIIERVDKEKKESIIITLKEEKSNEGIIVSTCEEYKDYLGKKVVFRNSFVEDIEINNKQYIFFRDFYNSIFYILNE